MSSTSSNGLGGVYCDISKDGRTLAAANIDGSTVSIYPLKSGVIGDPTFVFKYTIEKPGPGKDESQTQAYPHAASFDPSGKFLFVPDRGADMVYVYQVDGPESVKHIHNITVAAGTGPRHVTFSKVSISRTFMYLVGEIDNTVTVFALDGVDNSACKSGENGELRITHIQTASTLGPGANRTAFVNEDLASEVAVTNDGRFLYVSNRNTKSYDSDTLAVYAVHPSASASASSSSTNTTTGSGQQHLEFLALNPTHGKIPRHFSLSPDAENRFVAVGNQVSNDVTVLARNPKTGLVEGVVGNYTLGEFDETTELGPMAVVWA